MLGMYRCCPHRTGTCDINITINDALPIAGQGPTPAPRRRGTPGHGRAAGGAYGDMATIMTEIHFMVTINSLRCCHLTLPSITTHSPLTHTHTHPTPPHHPYPPHQPHPHSPTPLSHPTPPHQPPRTAAPPTPSPPSRAPKATRRATTTQRHPHPSTDTNTPPHPHPPPPLPPTPNLSHQPRTITPLSLSLLCQCQCPRVRVQRQGRWTAPRPGVRWSTRVITWRGSGSTRRSRRSTSSCCR